MQELESDIKSARKGDKEAFIRLIKAIELNLYGVARSIVKRDEDCADAIQETILRAYSSISALKEPAYFKTWIFRILINECNKILRKQRKSIPALMLQDDSPAMDDYEDLDLKDAIDKLEEALRLVITLHYFEDIPLKEIAEMLETPEGTIKSRLHRARRILANYLQVSNERNMNYESC